MSCFAESAAGVESGSRTGLSNLSTAFFFLLCMLFSPLFLMIPGAATGSALIVVGISMLETLRDVDFSGSEFLPVAVMLLVTAYKGDYVAGIALSMFTYLVVSVIPRACKPRCEVRPAVARLGAWRAYGTVFIF